MVLPGTDLHGAYLLAERVRQGVESLRAAAHGRATARSSVTASLGVAALPESADDQDGLVAAADAAMYDAKRAGKNRAMRAQRDPRSDACSKLRHPMGLLDDAIREHLELKRRHGADPDEVARQEQRGARSRPPHRRDGAGAGGARGRARA